MKKNQPPVWYKQATWIIFSSCPFESEEAMNGEYNDHFHHAGSCFDSVESERKLRTLGIRRLGLHFQLVWGS
jgi:hypothetical protein